MKRAPCPTCGARTEKQAGTRCQAQQDQTGEYWCPGTDVPTDKAGFFLYETAKSIARFDAWIDTRIANQAAGVPGVAEEDPGRG
jgi:hypothetical protein